jgi:glycerophosphoryl diester phosphodiesterase
MAKIPPASAWPLLLGHRGARANKSIPENTFASFDQALADGCDGFEFDVRRTADGEAVVCHDVKIGAVEIATALGREVKGLPRLEQVLKRYGRDAFLDIELKVAGLEIGAAHLSQRYKIHRGFVVSSFLPEVLRGLQRKDPGLPLGLICETRAQLKLWRTLPVEYVIVRYSLAGKALIREIQQEKKKVLVWTVNNRVQMKKFAEWGVDGIISDETRMLRETLGPATHTRRERAGSGKRD